MNKKIILTTQQRYQRVYYLRHKRARKPKPKKERAEHYNVEFSIPKWLFRPRIHTGIRCRKKRKGQLDPLEIVNNKIILRLNF
jgi:hypothetical protein